MVKKKTTGLVDYSGQPTVIKNMFGILPDSEVKGDRKQSKKK